MLWAELKEENGHEYRHPAILNYDEVALPPLTALMDEQTALQGRYEDYWQHALWRFGTDASIHLPSGLYLTASRGELPPTLRSRASLLHSEIRSATIEISSRLMVSQSLRL